MPKSRSRRNKTNKKRSKTQRVYNMIGCNKKSNKLRKDITCLKFEWLSNQIELYLYSPNELPLVSKNKISLLELKKTF
jgi:hypothetical protein